MTELKCMDTNVSVGIATGPASPARDLPPLSLETLTMETTRRRHRVRRHAERLAQHTLAGAGARKHVGAALGKSLSTISHEVTSRANPDLVRAFEILLTLNAHPETTGRPYAEAVHEAQELHDLIGAEDSTLIERGLFLLSREDLLEADENRAARSGVGYSRALRAEAFAQIELAALIDECALRGIDLHALYCEHEAAA